MIESVVRIFLGVFAFFGAVFLGFIGVLAVGTILDKLFSLGLVPDDRLVLGTIVSGIVLMFFMYEEKDNE